MVSREERAAAVRSAVRQAAALGEAGTRRVPAQPPASPVSGSRAGAPARAVRRRTVRRVAVPARPLPDSAPADGVAGGGAAPEVAAGGGGAPDGRATRPRPSPRPRPPRQRVNPTRDASPGADGEASPGADGEASPSAAGDGAGRPGAGKARRGVGPLAARLAVAVLALLVAAGAVTTGLSARDWYDQRQLAADRQSALAAARQTTVNFVSISASTVDKDLKRISDGATGQFKDEFTQDTAQVRAAVVANKVDSRGTVLRAAIVSANHRAAVVLVAVDATVKNTSAPDGRLSHYRIRVNLNRDAHSGRWLVAQLQFVG